MIHKIIKDCAANVAHVSTCFNGTHSAILRLPSSTQEVVRGGVDVRIAGLGSNWMRSAGNR